MSIDFQKFYLKCVKGYFFKVQPYYLKEVKNKKEIIINTLQIDNPIFLYYESLQLEPKQKLSKGK